MTPTGEVALNRVGSRVRKIRLLKRQYRVHRLYTHQRLNTVDTEARGTSGNLISKAGMYLKATIGGVEVTLLIDTGATMTLLSKKLHRKISKKVKMALNPVQQNCCSEWFQLENYRKRGIFFFNRALYM